jgi:hypothetical protein
MLCLGLYKNDEKVGLEPDPDPPLQNKIRSSLGGVV